MQPVAEFLNMGGYAAFVWPCFALALVVMGWIFVASRRELKQREKRLAELRAASPRRRRHGDVMQETGS